MEINLNIGLEETNMKKLLIITIFLSATSVTSHAFEKKTNKIDFSQYELLARQDLTTDIRDDLDYLAQECGSMIQQAQAELLQKVKSDGVAQNKDPQTECSEILTAVGIQGTNKGKFEWDSWGIFSFFTMNAPIHHYNSRQRLMTVQVFCKPRTISDMAVVSFGKHCIQNFDANCAQNKSLLDSIKATTYPTITAGSCR
jgi:hypothetical protein